MTRFAPIALMAPLFVRLLFAPNARAEEAVVPFLEPSSEVYSAAKPTAKCDPKANSAFDAKSKVLTVCDGSKVLGFKIPVTGKFADITEIDPTRAPIRDYDGDGKTELLLFRGQCVEGPCLGAYTLARIDGDKLRGLTKLQAELIDVLADGDKAALRLNRICFDYEFGSGLDYFAIAAFDKSGHLALLPNAEVRKRFAREFPTPAPSKKTSARDTALTNIQALIYEAYGAKDLKALEASYAAAIKPLKQESLGIYCDPLELIRYIARH